MPNWCSNEVDVIASPTNPEEFEAFLKLAHLSTQQQVTKAFNSDHKLFDRLVPMPKQLRNTTGMPGLEDEFSAAMKGDKTYKYTDWYHWRLAHWGTKWDVDLGHIDLQDHQLQLSFDTAWSPANGIWETVSKKFPSLTIKVRYLEEGMNFIGETNLTNGETTKDICLEISKEMYVAVGVPLDDEGNLDWDNADSYNLYDLFDDGLEKWEE